jgi:DNA polymerase III delta prime subunit
MKYINHNIEIEKKLIDLYKNKQVPNIIFYGNSGSGKKTILKNFLIMIYGDIKKSDYVMIVNCCHNKGIKFIKEDLKFFSKSSVFLKTGEQFKSIILLNADSLTNDAQSALRRSIELYSTNTRFFIVTDNKDKLLKPIISRFSHIHVLGIENKKSYISFYTLNIYKNAKFANYEKNKINRLNTFVSNNIDKLKNISDISFIIHFIDNFHSRGFSVLDFMKLIEIRGEFIEYNKRIEILTVIEIIKSEYFNDKLLMLFIINFAFMDVEIKLS